MLPLRIAFDMDGTLADLHSAYAKMEEQVLGADEADHEQPAPEVREAQQHQEGGVSESGPAEHGSAERRSARSSSQHRDRVWRAIEATPDFWTTLDPIDPGAMTRLYQ